VFRCLGKAADHFNASSGSKLKRLVILMTDGQDGVGENGEVQTLKSLGIPVVAVGFGSDADMQTLSNIATATRGAAIESTDMVKALRDATSYK
jgi:Ca-activated chloride channel family protein